MRCKVSAIRMALGASGIVFCLVAGAATINTQHEGELSRENIAIKAAEKTLVNTYGEAVLRQRPFRAKLDGEFWIIDGTLHCPDGSVCKGGTAHIVLSKKDGRIRKLLHGK